MEAYSVQLDIFCGPLDLLLQLIRSDEIEVTNISLAKVADQFVEHLKSIEFSDLELAADFIVVASHLIELKSRELLPADEQGDEVEEIQDLDRGSDLIRRLLEYRTFKDLARRLRARMKAQSHRHGRGWIPELPPLPVHPDTVLEGVTLWDLVSSFMRIARDTLLQPTTKIVYDEIPIGDHIDDILAFLADSGSCEFSVILKRYDQKSRFIGAFLALLELIREKIVAIRQDEDYGAIFIQKSLPEDFEDSDENIQPPTSFSNR
jgi:segregation and condensation protein A